MRLTLRSIELMSLGIVIGLIIGGLMFYLSASGVFTTTFTKSVFETITSTSILSTTHQDKLCMELKVMKERFLQSEPVVFRFINNCNRDIALPNSSPWVIKDIQGRVIFSPISAQVIKTVEPGQYVEWSWDQRDNRGNKITPGKYFIVLQTSTNYTITADFFICC